MQGGFDAVNQPKIESFTNIKEITHIQQSNTSNQAFNNKD